VYQHRVCLCAIRKKGHPACQGVVCSASDLQTMKGLALILLNTASCVEARIGDTEAQIEARSNARNFSIFRKISENFALQIP
jgi:hypothetical protein